mmetsp:Transcript_27156/g.24033  ORF Transcript_27156/g.24033 Transcript_27156/m.24033 type:complete len:90 (-) Transcript_27156:29-298(-)
MLGNFTEGQTVKVKEETSEFNSTIGLDKISLTKKNNYLNETGDYDNESDSKDSKGKMTNDFFKDYLLNSRPEYYGDTSDIMSKSRKLYY